MTGKYSTLPVFVLGLCAWAGYASAQHSAAPTRVFASNLVMPQAGVRAFAPGQPEGNMDITQIEATVKLLDQVATTTLGIRLRNPTPRRQEAELLMPVPDQAVIRSFTYEGAGPEGQAEILPKEEARRIYNNLVSKIRDPAILEFAGYNLVRSSVFPVEAHGTQWVRLTYEHMLPMDGNRIDYVLPRSESLSYSMPWKITCDIQATKPISTVYSSSHSLEVSRESAHRVRIQITTAATKEPGAFQLSYLLQTDGVSASMFSYPDPKVGGGYFLLFAGLPAEEKDAGQAPAVRREVTLVLDTSGSMNGEKIQQAREAALQVIAGLGEGESFNIILYSNSVECFSESPVLKDAQSEAAARKYIQGIQVSGGTNIYDAMVEALRQKPTAGCLPLVLFLTDGLPTVGRTSEVDIREVVEKHNPYQRRVFTFGVGVDVNAPLLERIAAESRARATFVLPQEDVEVKVGQVFRQLKGPVLTDPQLGIVTADGEPARGRTREILPNKLADLFEGDQLVLLGQYVGEEPITFVLRGNYRGRMRTFQFDFDFSKATTRNGYVPRLWASRKIAVLIDDIRQMGADPYTAQTDPKVKELVDEIVRLSTEFGILTEYTAFLARDGTDLANAPAVSREAGRYIEDRAMKSRSGLGAVSQSLNLMQQKQAVSLNRRNEYLDQHMNRVSVSEVQQINDRAFYYRGNRWVDSRLLAKEREIRPAKVISFGSEEFDQLVSRLSQSGRQGSVALRGDILLDVDGEPVLVKGPGQ